MNQHRIDRLLEARSLEAVPAEDAEIAAIWPAVLREWSDAALPGLSVPGAFMHVYQEGFRTATALVRAAGYRVRGAVGSHHYATFYAAAALGDHELERIADAMQNVRGGRHAALYGDDEELEPEDLAAAREHVAHLLAAVRAALLESRPSLADRIGAPSIA